MSLPARALACGFLASAGLSACGGGGGSDGGTPNSPPTANAGTDRTVVELSNVELNGSATDPDGGTLSYAWTQTGGTDVTLTNASSAQASFDAPDVAAGAPEALTFRLTVTDSAGASDFDEVQITVQEPGDTVTISGVVSYEFVPANPECIGLNYPLTVTRSIRRATVQVLDASSNALLGEDVADDNGSYEISVDPGLEVFVRVRAELKRGGAPSWDVEVRDNTSNTEQPLRQRPLYVLDSGDFASGLVDQTRNLTATTGWNGTSYASTRAAAPFAILDAIYEAMQAVLTADAQATFPALDVFWSVNNRPSAGPTNIDTGEIGTSFYRSDNVLFLLGQENEDTEEFDDHVIVHEWGHYFEDEFSRSDSIGGSHGVGDRLDMRVAFGEGWATALSGIALDNPIYCDTQGPQQATGFEIDIENDSAGTAGWFNELSVLGMIYDLWDTDTDGADNDSIGFDPIFATMTTSQAATAAHTSIFSFLDGLEDVTPVSAPFIDSLRTEYDINGTGIYGDGETNDAGGAGDVLPVYTEIRPDGTPLNNICANNQFDNSNPDGNKLSEFRFLRMEIVTQAAYEFDVATNQATLDELPEDDPNDPSDQSDPDIFFYLNGEVQNAFVNGDVQGTSGVANRENFTTPNELVPGTYALDLQEWRYEDPNTHPDFPSRSCFDITITPVP